MPDLQLEYEELTKKDLEFINFAIKNDLDFIGVSFTNNRGHITKINNAIGEDNLKVIAKIETQRNGGATRRSSEYRVIVGHFFL